MTISFLIVGETYLTKDGQRVRIHERKGIFRKMWSYVGSNDVKYRDDGKSYFMFNRSFDLVEVSEIKLFDDIKDAFIQALSKAA